LRSGSTESINVAGLTGFDESLCRRPRLRTLVAQLLLPVLGQPRS
jgi:hypothetical protein